MSQSPAACSPRSRVVSNPHVGASATRAGSHNVYAALAGHGFQRSNTSMNVDVGFNDSIVPFRAGKHQYPTINNATNFKNGVLFQDAPTYVLSPHHTHKVYNTVGQPVRPSRRSNHFHNGNSPLRVERVHRLHTKVNKESGTLIVHPEPAKPTNYSLNSRFKCRPESRRIDAKPAGPVRSVALGYTDRLM